MKNLNVKLGFAALLIGSVAALSTNATTLDKTWGFNQSSGMYVDLTGKSEGTNYRCNDSENTCTATYPSAVNPNDQDHDQYPGIAEPSSTTAGDYIAL